MLPVTRNTFRHARIQPLFFLNIDPGTTSLVFDFANLEYISSAGLRLVIAAYKKMAGKEGFRIVNVSDEVYDVFSLTGFDQKINIEKK